VPNTTVTPTTSSTPNTTAAQTTLVPTIPADATTVNLDLTNATSAFGANEIPGVEPLDVSNSTNGLLTISSVFSSTTSLRRALSSKSGYDFQDKVAYLSFNIDQKTTSGNVAELWMYSGTKFVQAALSITPTTLATRINVAYAPNNISTPQAQSMTCAFVKNTDYTLQVRLTQTLAVWTLSGQLLFDNSVVCTINLQLVAFPASQFFSTSFKLVISQSSSNAPLQRTISQAPSEVTSITIRQLGVICPKGGQCAASASSPEAVPTVASTLSFSPLTIGVVVSVVVAVLFALTVAFIVVIIVVGVIHRRRKRRVKYQTDESITEEEHSQAESQTNLQKYNAFGTNDDYNE
jgi:hypothetical protein